MTQGTVVAICIAPEAGLAMRYVNEVEALVMEGLRGDRYAAGAGSFNKKAGKGHRQVTLMNSRFFRGTGFEYHDTRRNIFTEGVELMDLIGKGFRIGDAVFVGTRYCDPCMRPSKLAGKMVSFKDKFQDCGGIIARVEKSGIIRQGSIIIPPRKDY